MTPIIERSTSGCMKKIAEQVFWTLIEILSRSRWIDGWMGCSNNNSPAKFEKICKHASCPGNIFLGQ